MKQLFLFSLLIISIQAKAQLFYLGDNGNIDSADIRGAVYLWETHIYENNKSVGGFSASKDRIIVYRMGSEFDESKALLVLDFSHIPDSIKNNTLKYMRKRKIKVVPTRIE